MTRVCEWGVSYILLFSLASEFLIRITGKAIGCWNLLGAKTEKKEGIWRNCVRSCKAIDVQLNTEIVKVCMNCASLSCFALFSYKHS